MDDTWKTYMLSDSLVEAPPRIRMNTLSGVGGELRDIEAILHACLQVGRIERAGIIMKRLRKLEEVTPEQMRFYNNRFLECSLNRILTSRSRSAAHAMHKYFELEINDKGVPYDAETLAYMLKASLQTEPGKRQERLIRRYMSMASEDVGLQILGDSMFSAQDLHDITAVAQNYNFGPEVAEEVAEDNRLTAWETKLMQSDRVAPLVGELQEVMPTEQKGLGLKSLKRSLAQLVDKSPDFDPSTLDENANRERQIRIEEDAVNAAIDRWREDSAQLVKMGLDTHLQTKNIGSRMWRWHNDLKAAMVEEMKRVDEAELATKKTAEEVERCQYGPFLRYLPLDKLCAATILSTMSQLSTRGIDKGLPLAAMIMNLANSIEDESITEKLLRDEGKVSWGKVAPADRAGFLARQFRSAHATHKSIQKILDKSSRKAHQTNSDSSTWDPQWSASIKAKLGAVLLENLINTAKVPISRPHPKTGEITTQLQPAFMHAYQYKMGKRQGVVHANNFLVQQMKREPVHSLLAKHLPMVVEPVPWSKFNEGGFLRHPAKMVRIKLGDKDQRNYTEAAIENGDMETMFKALDVLGRTSWRINQFVFQTMLEAWNKGDGIANIPPLNPNLKTPKEPEVTNDPTERRKWLRQMRQMENLRGSLHSQRCFQNFQLEIARALVNEKFYFPHNLDFRGRAYPIPPYLNHMGADNCRGLLVFGKGRELGTEGLRWLKIHLANVYGYDKASLSDRENFAMSHTDDIEDSVSNPLGGRRWWLKAEDPWQCLAACHELKMAMDSEEPTKFISHLPIHQDGTCNGLQHYAALGGDEWGAKQVNLEPGDRPADVYTAVADLVRESILEDKAKGNAFAKFLDGKITRKVVKQTVMTNVYGVTFIGAKAQVRKQLVAAIADIPQRPDLNPDYLASYVTTKIFKSLSTMFKGAHDIQNWLGECANRITVSLTPEQLNHVQSSAKKYAKANGDKALLNDLQFKSSIIWTNPVSMPIVQPYRSSKSRIVVTNLQRISISEPHSSDPVSKRKQLQGFPPNFVHSLDATHMVVSALACDQKGLSFAAVHDSFWTHAGDVSAMNEILRDSFIKIHTDDVIGRLAAELQKRYSGGLYLAKLKYNSKVAEAIKAWRADRKKPRGQSNDIGDTYGPRRIKLQEILEEKRRMALLASSDPAEVAEGKAMVTAASIIEQMGEEAEKAFLSPDEAETMGLGKMSKKEALAMSMMENAQEEALFDDVDEMPDEDELAIPEQFEDGEQSEGAPARMKSSFEEALFKKVSRQTDKSVYAWLPLTFPPVPEKVCPHSS